MTVRTATAILRSFLHGRLAECNREALETILAANAQLPELYELLENARCYITPTISTHEHISRILGWCDCGYCKHVKHQP